MENPDQSPSSTPAPDPDPAGQPAPGKPGEPAKPSEPAPASAQEPAGPAGSASPAGPGGPGGFPSPATPAAEPALRPEPPLPSGPASLRASDADRDKVADLLREALAEGRLTPDEHADRIDAVYAARTYAELRPIVEDLPTAGDMPFEPARPGVELHKDDGLPAPLRESSTITAIFAGAERKGRWLVEAHTNVQAVFGGAELDFRQAVLSQREVTVNIVAICGGVEVTVPPGVRVVGSGAAVFGGWQLPGDDTVGPDAPVIRFTGLALFGGVDVKRSTLSPK